MAVFVWNKDMTLEKEQTCQICNKVLSLEFFHKDSSRRSGHSRKCKSCMREKSAAYRKTKNWAAYQRERLGDDVKRSNIRAQQVAWRQRNPLIDRAYATLHFALKRGAIFRPQQCSDCKKDCKPEAHHDDYTKPLDVAWLCKLCHEARHHG